MQKGLSTIWIILIILFGLILISGGILVYFKFIVKNNTSPQSTQTQSEIKTDVDKIETADWQTGSFESITFKYPLAWDIEKSPETDTDVIYLKTNKFVKDNTGSNGPDNPLELSFEISDTNTTNIDSAITTLSGTGEGFLTSNKQPQKIDTIDGERDMLTLVNQSKDDTVFFIYKSKLYKIMVSSFSILSDKDNADFKSYFDAVLSTIKLI